MPVIASGRRCTLLTLTLTPLCNHICALLARSHWSSGTDKRSLCWCAQRSSPVANKPQVGLILAPWQLGEAPLHADVASD